MTVWAALAGGFAGTLVLTIALTTASQVGLTRMDIPFLLGTAVSPHRTAARVIGFALHFVVGLAFALLYFALFLALGRAGWLLGLVFGLVHALFAGTALVNILLPAIHPRMGTPYTGAAESPFLEPPGFLLLNYGRATPIATILAHCAYGAIVGGFIGRAIYVPRHRMCSLDWRSRWGDERPPAGRYSGGYPERVREDRPSPPCGGPARSGFTRVNSRRAPRL